MEHSVNVWSVLVLMEPAILEEAYDYLKPRSIGIIHSKVRWDALTFLVVLIVAVQQP